MTKIALILAAALLAAPKLAHAKAGAEVPTHPHHAKPGVEFQTSPDTAKPGEKINFTVIAMREPPPGGGGRTQPQAIVGRHPLVTFRSGSGRVVHVWAG